MKNTKKLRKLIGEYKKKESDAATLTEELKVQTSVVIQYLDTLSQFVGMFYKDMDAITSHMEEAEKKHVESLCAELDKYSSLISYAFDPDVNIRFENILSRANLVGASVDRIIDFDEGAALFGGGKPVVI